MEKDLDKKIEEIIKTIPSNYSNDLKLRKLYIEICKLLSKSTEFFYDKEPKKQKNIIKNYKTIENGNVVCRSAVYLFVKYGKKLGLNLESLKVYDSEEILNNHWALVYKNNGKKYLINPIHDFYRVQMGFNTYHFCYTEDYTFYKKEKFNRMPEEYIRDLDKKIGYLQGDMYTNELLEKLSNEVRNKLGNHIIKTSSYYQDYYLKLLTLIENDKLTTEDKIKEIEIIDKDASKDKEIFEECFNKNLITKRMKKLLYNKSFRNISNNKNNEVNREGSLFIDTLDVSNLKSLKKDILLYKFKYMMSTIPKLSTELTGYIENKNFMDELSKYFFQKDEEKYLKRHTLVKENINSKKEYYLCFVLELPETEDSLYCIYDHNKKTFDLGIDPMNLMIENSMRPLKESSLNKKVKDEINKNPKKRKKKYKKFLSNLGMNFKRKK